jgi:hypothetical protein
MQNYASIAVIDQIKDSELAIWKISVSTDGAELSGAWVFDSKEIQKYEGILEGSLIIQVCNSLKDPKIIEKYISQKVELKDFLDESRTDVEASLAQFEEYVAENERKYKEYMAIEPSARKLLPKIQKKQLVSPVFSDWPKEFDFDYSKEFLDSMKKSGLLEVENNELKNVVVAARVVQLLIQMWQADESERKIKIYVDALSAESTILPRIWLRKVSN